MTPYLRLATKEFAPFAALFTGLVLLTLCFYDFRESMVLPVKSHAIGLMSQWVLYGIALGFATGCWEEGRGSLDYTMHRGLSYLRQVRLCHWPALGCLALFVVLPLVVWAVAHGVLHPDAGAAKWDRLGTLMMTGTITVAAYAVGFWSGSLREAWLARLGAAVVVGFGLMGMSRQMMLPGDEDWVASRTTFVLAQAAVAAVFLFAGHRSLALGRDRDLPAPTGATILNGALFACVLGLFVSETVRGTQRTHLMGLHSEYPSFVRFLEREDGSDPVVGSLSNNVPGVDGFVHVDDSRRPLDEGRAIEEKYETVFSPWSFWAHVKDRVWERESRDSARFERHGVPFEGPWKKVYSAGPTHAHLDTTRGVLRAVIVAEEGAEASEVELWPGDMSFSQTARVMGNEDHALPVLIHEPTDGSVWAFDVTGRTPTLERVPTPGGDPVIAQGTGQNGVVVVETDGGMFQFEGGSFGPIDGEVEAEIRAGQEKKEAQVARRFAQWATIEDPVRYRVTVEVDGAQSEIAFEPVSLSERRRARVIEWSSLLRPPALLVASALRPLPTSDRARLTFEHATVLDPLYAGGKRRGAVGLALIVAAALGLLSIVYVRRIGATTGRAAAWFVLILATGLPGLVALFLFETRRAWRWQGATFAPPPPPRIVTARGGA